MSIYTVTFCAQDRETGSNPMWHSCLLLSRLDETTRKMEVVNSWGFYPVKGSNHNVGKFKKMTGLEFDFKDNHGILRREEMRFLNLGYGLRGATFELTKEKFEELQAKCEKMAKGQEQAIKKAVKRLKPKATPKPAEETRTYPYEHVSAAIYKLEKRRAAKKRTSPRLKPFELRLSMSLFGPSLNSSETCKTILLEELLKDILTKQQLERLTENGAHRAMPRFSGKMETIFLHSSGPLREHKKKSGEIVYNHDNRDSTTKLHWTIPPQEIETLSDKTRKSFKLHGDRCEEVKKIVRQLQTLERLFRNSTPSEYAAPREELLSQIKKHYETFAKIKSKQTESPSGSLPGYVMSFFAHPRSEDEAQLIETMAEAKGFIHSLYAAIVEGWKIEEDGVEALAAYLPVEKKKELCSAIGRTYLEPLEDERLERKFGV